MLSSISSLFPSSVQEHLSKVGHHSHQQPLPHVNDEDDEATDGNKSDTMAGVDEMGVKKKGKRDKSANETFIVVRPPPAKTNHPLNLQVQLVPPNPRGGPDRSATLSSRQSIDYSAPASPTAAAPTSEAPLHDQALSRTSSVRSYASTEQSYSNSVSSFASTTSTSSGRRMIIPLYNLQAHNVMTNLVVDAGTDAKVAKFLKRGLEIIGLMILEPFEVYGASSSNVSALVRTSKPLAEGGQGSSFSTKSTSHHEPVHHSSRPNTPEQGHTPTSSAISVSDVGIDSQHPHNPTISLTPADSAPIGPAPTGTKKLFGKFFNKKRDSTSLTTPTISHARTESAPSSPSTPIPVTTPTSSNIISRHSKRLSASFSKSPTSATTPMTASIPPPHSAAPALGHLVLGIQPTISLPSRKEKSGRPTMYVWVVRKWLKVVGGESLLGGLVGKLGGKEGGVGFKDALGLGGGNGVGGMVEVRFEWKRGKRKGKDRLGVGAGRARKHSIGGSANGGSQGNSVSGSNAASTTSLPGAQHRKREGTSPARPAPASAEKKSNRLSTISISQHSITTSITSEGGGDRERGGDEVDDGDESDPEDSETPWNCTLKIRRLNPPGTPVTPPTPHGDSTTSSYASDSLRKRGGGQDKDKAFDLRLKIAMLSPTPHHPKVVALLKVPFPLPDVEIEKAELRPRAPSPEGGQPHSSGVPSDVLMLTAEEIKDVVSSTGLWLVVREGFGGVGKVSRKGDGWRIRG